jgi:hypothetical protein
MADIQDTVNSTDTGGGDYNAQAYQEWVTQAQARLASGQSLDNSGMWDPAHGHFGTPLGYQADNGQLVKDNNLWGSIWPGLVGMALVGAGGMILAPEAATSAATEAGVVDPVTDAGSAGDAAATGADTTTATSTDVASTVAPSGPGVVSGGTGHFASDGTWVADSSGGSNTATDIANLVKAGGQALGQAATAQGNNALTSGNLAIAANNSNIAANNSNTGAESAYQSELLNMAKAEQDQRSGSLNDVARESLATNPRVSPYDPTGGPKYSQQYLDTLANLGGQGANRLASSPQYSTTGLPSPTAPTPVKPINPPAPGSSTLQQISNWVAPVTSVAPSVIKAIADWA